MTRDGIIRTEFLFIYQSMILNIWRISVDERERERVMACLVGAIAVGFLLRDIFFYTFNMTADASLLVSILVACIIFLVLAIDI